MKKRIKVLHAGVKAGGGHIALRDFLHQELSSDAENFRSVSWTHPGEALETADTIIHTISPFLYELAYFMSPRYLSDISVVATFNFFRECYRILKSEKPDIVLSTHFVLSLHFAFAKHILRSKAIIVSCIPDYGPPSKIMHPRIKWIRPDRLMVFEQWTKQGAAKVYKIPEEDVLLAGYNPKPIFKETAARYKTKTEARIQLKKVLDYKPYTLLDPDKTTVLVSAGAVDSRKTYKMLKAITAEQENDPALIDRYQYLVITGRDMKYFEKLSRKNKKLRSWSNVFPLAWVDSEVYALIQNSCDFPILSGIAPATMNELVESKCGPLVVFRTRPGQELPHRTFIEEKGLGWYVPEKNDLLELLTKGISAEDRARFLERGRSFRAGQAERAAQLPGLMQKLYQEDGPK